MLEGRNGSVTTYNDCHEIVSLEDNDLQRQLSDSITLDRNAPLDKILMPDPNRSKLLTDSSMAQQMSKLQS